MKKILIFIYIVFGVSAAKAQSAEETVEWLNIKKNDIYTYGCRSKQVQDQYAVKTLEFTSTFFKLSDDKGGKAVGAWKNVKEVKKISNIQLEIIFVYDGASSDYVNIRLSREDLLDKFFRAFKHMATLNGAKMIDSDLF